MKKLIYLFLALLFIGCASVSNKSANPSKVDFNFQSENGLAALTFWKKINSDGTMSSPFAIGVPKSSLLLNSSFPKAYAYEQQLDAGYYFMDSFQISDGRGGYVISEKKHYSSRNGWDKTNNQPYYLAFRVEEGKDLSLPTVIIVAKDGDSRIGFKFDDINHIFILGTKADKK
jgi:hypothetical protein